MILYLIVFYILFISIINKNLKTINNSLTSLLKTFWQPIIRLIPSIIIEISKVKIYCNTFFKNIFNKSSLTNEMKKNCDFRYGEKNLIS